MKMSQLFGVSMDYIMGLSYALAKGKHFTREEFVSMLLTSVNDIDSRFEGSKTSGGTINLEKYRGKMGTGLTDAYQLLMQIEGTPCLKVKTGKLELVTLTKHFGGSAKDLTYMGVEVSAEDMQKLGMAVEPKMYNGQLMIKCTKPGVAHITVAASTGPEQDRLWAASKLPRRLPSLPAKRVLKTEAGYKR